MADGAKGWRPDPFGTHELRYFSMDGRPTRLVRDAEVLAHDPPPPVMPPTATRGEPTRLVRDSGVESCEEPPSISVGTKSVGPADGGRPAAADGWLLDPSGRHEYRYFHRGKPTSYVTDSREQSRGDAPPPLTELSDVGHQRAQSQVPPASAAVGWTHPINRIRKAIQRVRTRQSNENLAAEVLGVRPSELAQTGLMGGNETAVLGATLSGAPDGPGRPSVSWLSHTYGFSTDGSSSSEN
jgi:hypothetical protein